MTSVDEDFKDWNNASDEEIEGVGMYRCGCGQAVYPSGDPDDQHCALDV